MSRTKPTFSQRRERDTELRTKSKDWLIEKVISLEDLLSLSEHNEPTQSIEALEAENEMLRKKIALINTDVKTPKKLAFANQDLIYWRRKAEKYKSILIERGYYRKEEISND